MQKRLFGILASVAIIVAACGGASATSAPPASTEPGASTPAESAPPASESNLAADQTLNVTAQGEPPTLDPNKAQDSNSITILSGLVRGLVYFDKDLKVVPGLASSWDISPDAKMLTFHLRDAKYSNGDPITAGDFVYSFKRLIDYGYHPPTIYFPLIVDEALLIEPTETESVETLDAFADALIAIAGEAETNPDLVTGAPHTAPVRRLDEASAARHPNLRWRPMSGAETPCPD